MDEHHRPTRMRHATECVKIFETTFLKSPEIHGGPLSCNVLQNLVFAKSPLVYLGLHFRIRHHFKPLVRFHFPVSPSFFYLLFVPPTGGLSLCWHRGMLLSRQKPLTSAQNNQMLVHTNVLAEGSLQPTSDCRRGTLTLPLTAPSKVPIRQPTSVLGQESTHLDL